jgi:DNA (cytosine-5)-methyltransferase 1
LQARDYKGINSDDAHAGGKLIVYETHPADSRINEMGETCQTVTSRWGTGGGNVPLVQPIAFTSEQTPKTSTNLAHTLTNTTYKHNQCVAFDSYNLNLSDTNQTIKSPQGGTLESVGGVIQAFRKSRRAQSTEDYETWVDDGKANTLNTFDLGDIRTTHVIAFEPGIAKREGGDSRFTEEMSPTLRKEMGDNQVAVAYSVREDAKANTFSATELNVSNAIGALRPSPQSHHAQVFVAQPLVLEDQGGSVINTSQTGIVGTLRSESHGHEPSILAHTFKVRGGCEGGGKGYLGQDEKAFTISTTQDQQLYANMAVRRLTPIECERLQGFPDGYTDIKPKNKATPDGPRYKALGNSMAVPCMAWIGEGIDMIENP